ncbi:TIGR00730 family Rossman fold protein [Alkalicaulis satelles]|uniref:Cytokinin riboside 5'-monophosphate phosphoribohydrolase n=1 Tax=Alkalicaulis satelles TaxID=2609175 RepID=A0A5M6ZH64_9PROT|nr:TIGR00730 family Rossman fold protein [Alkalicaulis satelles]
MSSVCIYCGSSTGANGDYLAAARAMGEALARRGVRLVYGGGQVGLMGAVADACLDAGGMVTGVIPGFLFHKEIAHGQVSDMRVVASMHERKQVMADEADAFIAMPGGLGTLEELFEVWTWSQLGRHAKPVGVLNAGGYYDRLLAFLDHMQSEQFVEGRHRAMLIEHADPDALMDRLAAYEHPGVIANLSRHQV